MASKTRPRRTRDLYQEVTDRIVAALERGVAPWVCPWRRDGEGGPPRNGSSNHVYRGVNVILTTMSGFGSARWYTFNQAKHLGASVRRGEKGTTVVYWRFIEAKGKANELSSTDDEGSRKIPLLRHFTVFNAEQIAWPDGSEHAVGMDGDLNVDVDADLAEARSLVDSVGADIRHGGTRAFYSPSQDFIRVPEARRFNEAADFYATVLHELAHWTGHPDRLARDLTGRFGSESYAAEELVAELAAAFLCADLGIAGKLQHAEYVGSWIKVLKGDKRAIFTASRLAQEAADHLRGVPAMGEAVESAQDTAGSPRAAA